MEDAFEGVLGHEGVKAELGRLLASGRLSHALLFSGPAGTGKRLVAQRVARALLCEGYGAGAVPCGRCPSCRHRDISEHPDFLALAPEVRGKGTRLIRIETIREAIVFASRRSGLSGRRVILIDDADTMNEAAQNCLLKTLEEPPPGVTFILVTGARDALLDTIISRTTPFFFGALTRGEIAGELRRRGAGEEAEALAALADGSLARALSFLEGGELERRDEVLTFLSRLSELGMEEIFHEADRLGELERGALAEWLRSLNTLLRDLLVLRGDGGSALLYNEDKRGELISLLPRYSPVLFPLLAEGRELAKRLLTNASPKLQILAFLIRLRDKVQFSGTLQ